MYDDEDDDDDDFVLSSDDGLVESASEKEYDSDKDPGWQPTVDVSSPGTIVVAPSH